MASEFDQYAGTYKEIIDRCAGPSGEPFEYFIDVRVALVAGELEASRSAPPARILDFGCGIGATEKVLRERFPSASIDAVDPSAESVKAAQSLGVRDAHFHVAEGSKLPFPAAAFDVIYSNGTFHHIDHAVHGAVFDELQRVLRPGGHMFIFENNPFNPLMVRGMKKNPFDAGTKMLFPWYLRRLVRRSGVRARTPRYYVFFPKALKALRWSERYLRSVPIGAQYYVWGTKA
jgi:SAM-dependent methyltransferase